MVAPTPPRATMVRDVSLHPRAALAFGLWPPRARVHLPVHPLYSHNRAAIFQFPRLRQFHPKLRAAMDTAESRRSPGTDDGLLRTIIERLVTLYQPERIYLFGSAARGDGGPDSDYDLMIVVADSTPLPLRDPGLAYRALWRLGAAVDPLVWTRTRFDSRVHLRASLPATVLREGKLLYEA